MNKSQKVFDLITKNDRTANILIAAAWNMREVSNMPPQSQGKYGEHLFSEIFELHPHVVSSKVLENDGEICKEYGKADILIKTLDREEFKISMKTSIQSNAMKLKDGTDKRWLKIFDFSRNSRAQKSIHYAHRQIQEQVDKCLDEITVYYGVDIKNRDVTIAVAPVMEILKYQEPTTILKTNKAGHWTFPVERLLEEAYDLDTVWHLPFWNKDRKIEITDILKENKKTVISELEEAIYANGRDSQYRLFGGV